MAPSRDLSAASPPGNSPAVAGLRVRLHDVAREAGVSTATADRAINGRPGVSAKTLLRVQQAVQRLAYQPDPAAAQLARARPWRLAFLLPAGGNSFIDLLKAELQALHPWLAEQRAVVSVQATDVFTPQQAAQAVAALQGQCDAAVLMVQDHPLVRDAVEQLAAAGVAVVTLVSDVQARGRAHFVGIDNVAAGRTAGTLLARFIGARPARVGVLLGARSLRDHGDRLFGFQQVLAEEHPQLELLAPLEGQDDAALNQRLVQELLAGQPDLAGLYSIGAGNEGVQAALNASGAAGRVVWVCHELTPQARRALLEGTASAVINQSAAHEVRSACRAALARLTRRQLLPDQERIRIEIYLKDNLP